MKAPHFRLVRLGLCRARFGDIDEPRRVQRIEVCTPHAKHHIGLRFAQLLLSSPAIRLGRPQPGADFAGCEEGLPRGDLRITSYNVCYTKLLRISGTSHRRSS